MAKFKKIETTYINGEQVFNFGGLVPPVLFPDPSPQPSPSPTPTPSITPTSTPTLTPTSSPSPTPTLTPTSSPTQTRSNTPTNTPTPTSTPTNTPTSSPSPTPSPSVNYFFYEATRCDDLFSPTFIIRSSFAVSGVVSVFGDDVNCYNVGALIPTQPIWDYDVKVVFPDCPTCEATLFDPDYQAVLSYAATQGYTLPSSSGQTLQNQLIVDMKAGDIWNDLDIFYVMATDGDEDFAKLNWKNPSSFNLVKYGSVDFTTNVGFNPNTANVANYLDTQFRQTIDATGYTLDNACRFLWDYDDTIGADNIYDGMLGGSANTFRGDNSTFHRINSSNNNLPTPFDNSGVGFKMIQRTSSTDVNMYNNSSTPTSYSVSSTTLVSDFQVLFRRGGSGTGIRKLSVYGLGASLLGKEDNLLNAITTYMSSL